MPRLRSLAVASLLVTLSACTSIPLHAPKTPSKPDPFPAPAPAPAPGAEQPPLTVPDPFDPGYEAPEEATEPWFGESEAAPAAPPLYGYTAAEKKRMTVCLAIADTAMHAAERRKAGKPLDAAIALYAGRRHEALNISTVRQVYADDFDDVWVYAVDFFQRCAVRLADMPAERLGLARSCMHRQLIGGRAIELKALRRSKSYVNNYFRRIGQSADDVVDAAWTSSDSRGDFKLKLWNDCLGPDAS